ncbi:MAG: 1-acyl-sn-glycerol-3-phosphate acyltransferase [Muribaculaceae bacterium]|nr:1-acyl-sn-glycerol-3-phosphate acyltransferase [Muribaculaceae bacterium]
MSSGPQQINVAEVVAKRLPRHSKFIPRFVTRGLERLICQDRLNELLRNVHPAQGSEAASGYLKEMGISVKVSGEENIPASGRFLFASNHPLGGLDGLALISLLGNRYDGRIKFIVNDLLMAVEPLKSVFLPVNKYGAQSRERVNEIEAEYAGDKQMITFPAGLCSRRQPDGKIHDLEWKKSVITLAVNYQRDIVPIYFDEANSSWFYRIADWRKRLGMKFNAEMILLPREMIKKENSTLHVVFGPLIPHTSLDAARPREEAQRLCDVVYGLKPSSK